MADLTSTRVYGDLYTIGNLSVNGNTILNSTLNIPVGDLTYGLSAALSLELGVNTLKSGAIKLHGSTSNAYGLIQATTTNLHIDQNGGSIYLGHYAGTSVILGPSGGWGTINSSGYSGNAATATKLAATKTINGTNFDGSVDITTSNWGTARNITIGNTTRSVNGSTTYSWTLGDIGAAESVHSHPYLPLSGGTMTGAISFAGSQTWPTFNQNTTGNAATVTNGVYTVGDQSISGFKTFNTQARFSAGLDINQTAGTGIGISLYAGPPVNPTYGLMFASTSQKGTHGSVSGDWATYFTMNTSTGRGWVFTTDPASTGGNVASISNTGIFTGTSFNSITGLASSNPLMNGTVAVGTSTLAARQDHVHPIDTSRAATNQTMYIGTTAVAINRASAALTLAGVSLSTLTRGTGLTGNSYNGSVAQTWGVAYGTTSTTACVGNDSRLGDARTPTDNSVTYAKINTTLTSRQAVGASAIDWSLGGVYTKAMTAITTFTFSNLQLNKTITLILSGNYTVNLPSYCKKINGTYDGSTTNYIQFHCTNATGGSEEVWYTISKQTT